MSESTPKHPTAAQIDGLVGKMERHLAAAKPTARQQAAAAAATAIRQELLGLALKFGQTPVGAPCSQRLQAVAHQITAIGGTVTVENEAAIFELRDAMREHGQEALFGQIFTPRTGYDRAKDAANNLRSAVLSKKLRTLFDEIFGRTSTEKRRAPVLRIDKVVVAGGK